MELWSSLPLSTLCKRLIKNISDFLKEMCLIFERNIFNILKEMYLKFGEKYTKNGKEPKCGEQSCAAYFLSTPSLVQSLPDKCEGSVREVWLFSRNLYKVGKSSAVHHWGRTWIIFAKNADDVQKLTNSWQYKIERSSHSWNILKEICLIFCKNYL